MEKLVQNNFNSLHNIKLLFNLVWNSNNSMKNKKSTPVLRKEGFELLNNLELLKKIVGKYSIYNVDYKLINEK